MTAEKRKSERKITPGTLHYSFRAGISRVRDVPALSIDGSSTGIGIYTVRPLNAGVTLRVGNFSDRGERKSAKVVWCKAVGKLLYRAGLSYN